MRSSPPLAVSTVVAVLLLAGCGAGGFFAEDPGELRTEDRPLAGEISAVELATSGALTLSPGDTPSLRVTAGENVLDELTSEVRGGRLVLDADDHVGNLGEVSYDLVLPSVTELELSGSGSIDALLPEGLERVTLSGSGEIVLDDLAVDDLAIALDGSGRIEADGSTDRQTVSIDGSGSYDAEGLTSEVAAVTIGGSGTADLRVEQTLDAVIEGSGTVTYSGDPQVTSRIEGSGTVRPR
jgi:hypothetical protein